MQDPRAGLRAPAGDGLHLPRPHAGRRIGDPWEPRHRVRGGGPMTEVSYPGVYIEETKTKIKVISGVATGVASKVTPSGLLGAGYKIVETQIEPGGLSMLLVKGTEHILIRMSDYRE